MSSSKHDSEVPGAVGSGRPRRPSLSTAGTMRRAGIGVLVWLTAAALWPLPDQPHSPAPADSAAAAPDTDSGTLADTADAAPQAAAAPSPLRASLGAVDGAVPSPQQLSTVGVAAAWPKLEVDTTSDGIDVLAPAVVGVPVPVVVDAVTPSHSNHRVIASWRSVDASGADRPRDAGGGDDQAGPSTVDTEDGTDGRTGDDPAEGAGGEQAPGDDGPLVGDDLGPQIIDAVIVDRLSAIEDGASAQAANYPSVLVNRTGVTERYSTDDVWEVWICDVTNPNVSYTLDEALDHLNGPVKAYFAWLSDDQYDVGFVPGGVLRSKYPWDASDVYKFQHPDCGGRAGQSDTAFLTREGIPEIAQHDEVTSNGMFVGINRSQFTVPTGGIIGLFTYDWCARSDCHTSFPNNLRRVYVDGAVLSPSTLFRRAQLETAVHELGHGLEWPHSFLGWNLYHLTGQYHNYLDVVSGGRWPSATPATNRLAAGWIANDDVAKHLSTTGAATYILYPPGQEGTQLLTLPGANATEYYAFGARVDQSFDNLDIWDGILQRTVDASGVTGFYIDQSCNTISETTGDCAGTGESWGLFRRTEPVYRSHTTDDPVTVYTGHSIPVGKSIVMGSNPDDATADWRVEVANRHGDAFTVWVGGHQAPRRPVNARATRDSGTQITVYWEPAPEPSFATWNFQVQYRTGTAAYAAPTTGSGTCANALGSAVRSCTITGLTAGTAYDVRVRGQSGSLNGSAWGPWTPIGGAVRNAEASAGDTELVVRWDPPSVGASYTTAKHAVQIRSAGSYAAPSAGTCSTTIAAGATRCTITGLTNATAYSVRVAALDSAGAGAWSAVATATPTASLADAPAKPTATAGTATLTVSWTAPADSTVTGHKVSYRTGTAAFATPTGGTCANTVAVGTTSCTITGLTNGTAYDVRIRAVTGAGDGPWSPPDAGMPRAKPSAPIGVTATARHQSIEVAWSLPSSSDAPPSTKVEMQYAVTAATPTWLSGCSHTSTAAGVDRTSCTITGLTNGTGYSFRVRFSNGTNSDWTTATATPSTTVPVQVSRPAAWASSDSALKVTWAALTSDAATGGSAITGYRLEHRLYTTSTTAPWETHTIDGPAASLVIGGLEAYRLYQVRVRAVNAVGAGPWSAPATGYISPTASSGAPSAVTATVRGSSLDLTWAPSADDTVLHYDVALERRDDANDTWASQEFIDDCVTPSNDATSCSITHYAADNGLDTAKQHRVRLRARNHRGNSAYTAYTQATTATGGTTPSFGTSTVAHQTWVVGTASPTLTLPLASGGTGALSYSLSPALPAGLSFSATARSISGTPTVATTGAVTYTYTVTDSATPTVNTATLTFTIQVQADSTPALIAVADVSVPLYRPISSITLPTATAGTGNISSVHEFAGTLPAGLSFDPATRRIWGTPTEKTTANLAWTARDADGDSYTATFSLTVTDPPSQTVAYPTVLVDQFDRVRLYTQPHPDDSYIAETWEVWVCDVPNGSLAITPTGVAKLLNDEITPYFRWLSDDVYRPTFVVGGSYQSTQNWTPASTSAMEHPGCGGSAGSDMAFTDRVGIPTLANNDDVSSNGMIVVYDRALNTLTDGLLLYDRCQPRTSLNACPRSFPANERRIHLDGGVVQTDTSSDPTARLRIAAHEIGQAIEFPHSFSAATPVNQHDNLTDLLSGGSFPLGTAAANRYAAGWIAENDVAKHGASTGSATYTLSSLGGTGTQLLTLPGRDGDEYYALGARIIQPFDALPAGKEGVEAYRVDHKATRVHSAMSCWTDFPSTTECYGHKRRHEPLTRSDSTDKSYGHLYRPGDARTVGELRFEVADRRTSSYTVWVGDKDAPAAPADVRISRESGTQMTVSWSAPASGTTPTGYAVQYRDGTAAYAAPTAGNGTCAAAQPAAGSCTITGLTNGTAYDVRVRALAADGGGPWSPVGGAARNVEASAGAASIGVTWDAPTAGASYTTAAHVVQIRTGANSFAAPPSGSCAVSTIAAGATGCLITGLINDTAYDVRVAAVDRYGAGAWSSASTATPKASLPTAPATPAVTSGNNMITVSWSTQSSESRSPAVVDNDGVAPGQVPVTDGADTTTVTGYAVQVRTGVGSFAAPSSGTCASTLGADATSCTITSLTNGTAYEVRLRTATSAGNGPWSANSQAYAASTPAAPASLTATAGHQRLTLTWSAPATAQPPVNSAVVQIKSGQDSYAAPSAGTCAGTLAAATTSCTITGLDNGTAYDVQVRFSNGVDSGWTTGSGTPQTDRPDAPAAPAVNSASRTSVTVSWQAPSDNGSSVTGYTLQHRSKTADNSAMWTSHTDTGATLSRTVTGLTTYAKYEFRVRASNANGDGLWSTLAEGGPVAQSKPAAPTGVTVTQTLTSLAVAWTAPRNSDVQRYTFLLQSRAAATDSWATQTFTGDCATLDITDVSCTITDYSDMLDFDPTKFHRAAVSATNHLGSTQSAWSSSSMRFTKPSRPDLSDIVNYRDPNNAGYDKAAFTATVADTGGLTLTGWKMRYREVPDAGNPPSWGDWNEYAQTGNRFRFELPRLQQQRRYDVQARAANDIGESEILSFRFRSGVPTEPTSVSASAGDRIVTLRATSTTGNGPAIAKWQFKRWTDDVEPCLIEAACYPDGWTDIAATATSINHTVTGLTPGTEYKFRVRAVTGTKTDETPRLESVAGIPSDEVTATPTQSSDGSNPGGGGGGGGDGGGGGGGGGGSPGGGGGAGRATSIRVSGTTRYDTAAAVGNRHVALLEAADAATGVRVSVDTLIVASGESFPDALAASALSRRLGAPVLLTAKGSLASAVRSFVTRHRIARAVIVGGPAAVSPEVSGEIEALSGVESVERIFGTDRFVTAAAVAARAGPPGRLCGSTRATVIVTTGRNFPDALIAGPLAYRGGHPIVLTERDRLPAATAQYLRASGATQAVIIGGQAAVSGTVVKEIEDLGLATQQISGADRSETSVRLARWLTGLAGTSGCFRKDSIGLATGYAFPDALAAAPLLGHYGAPLLLTSPQGVPQSLIDYAADGRLAPDFDLPPIITVGGRTAVPSSHATKLLANLPR